MRPTYAFTRIARGLLERPPHTTLSEPALLFLLRARLDSMAMPIPGVLTLGVAGLGERFHVSPAKVQRALRELQEAGVMRFDAAARLLYCVHAIEEDPPVTEQSTKAFARKLRDLPRCGVRDEIESAIGRVLQQGRYPKLFELWTALSGADSAPESAPESARESAPDCGALRYPLSAVPLSGTALRSPQPLSETPPPLPAFRYEAAWTRNPQPPFAAAAASDFIEAATAIPESTFGALVIALGVSKWRTLQLQVPPTLRRLVSDATYRDRILRGEFAAAGADSWRCAQCDAHHPPLEDCPSKCRGCGGFHPGLKQCIKLFELERREARHREAGSHA